MLHDKSNNIQTGQPKDTCALCTSGEDRTVNGAVSGNKQRTMGFGGESNSMTYTDTGQFITYQDRNTLTRYTDVDIWRPDVPNTSFHKINNKGEEDVVIGNVWTP